MNSNNNCSHSGYIGRVGTLLPAKDNMQAALFFSVGVTRQPGKDKEGNYRKTTDWPEFVIYGKRAESLAGILEVGQEVTVLGATRTSKQDFLKLDGSPVSVQVTNFAVEDVNIHNWAKNSQRQTASEPAPETAEDAIPA